MDLRKKRTLQAIREAFYELRRQKRLESITVTELCRIAQISKAAFYLHYRDMFDLSEKLQTEVIESIFSKIEDPMLVLTDPVTFINNFLAALESEKERVTTLFSDSQAAAMPTSIVSHLKEYIYAHLPQHRDNPAIPIYLTYWTMGSYYACMENSGQMDYRQVLKILEDIQPSPPKFD